MSKETSLPTDSESVVLKFVFLVLPHHTGTTWAGSRRVYSSIFQFRIRILRVLFWGKILGKKIAGYSTCSTNFRVYEMFLGLKYWRIHQVKKSISDKIGNRYPKKIFQGRVKINGDGMMIG